MKRRTIGLDDKPDKHTVLLLHFDGNVKDETGINSGLTRQNITYSTDSKFGQSVKFGYSNSYIKIPYKKELLPISGQDMTVDFWVKPNLSNDGMVCLYGNPSSGSYVYGVQLGLNKDSIIFYSGTDNSGLFLFSPFPQKVWTHIALVLMNNVFYFYINGVLKRTFNSNIPNYVNDLLLGIWRDYSYSLNGCIDEYRISNIARWTSNFTPLTKPY